MNQPKGPPSGTHAGVREPPPDACDSATSYGNKGIRSYDEGVLATPANLYEVQRRARLRW